MAAAARGPLVRLVGPAPAPRSNNGSVTPPRLECSRRPWRPRNAGAPRAVTLPADVARSHTGQPIACVEAMKMEMWLVAPAAATVAALHARAGDQVAAGALIAELEPPKEDTP